MIVTSFISPSTSMFFAGTDGHGVYRSTTGGATWVQSTSGITNGKITSLLMATPTNLFAATEGAGVFRSNDSGRTWTPFNTGLDNLYVTVLALDSARRLLAGTLGGMRRTVMMVPVELTAFRAALGEHAVHLRWSTATETNNAGFEVERRIASEADINAWLGDAVTGILTPEQRELMTATGNHEIEFRRAQLELERLRLAEQQHP